MRQGDNLFNIAEANNTTPNALLRANNITSVLPGQNLRVPAYSYNQQRARQRNQTTVAQAQQNVAADYTNNQLGNFELGTTNYMAPLVPPVPTPYTGVAYDQVRAMQRNQRTVAQAQAALAPVGMGNLRRFEATQTFPPNSVGVRRPRTRTTYGLWVAPQEPAAEPVYETGGGGGYTGYGGGGGGGYGSYTPTPYQGFTGAANRNPFGIRASDDRAFGAGIGLINWRI